MTLADTSNQDLLAELQARFHTCVFIAMLSDATQYITSTTGNEIVALGLCQYAAEKIHENMRGRDA